MNELSLVKLSERMAQGPLSPQDALHYAAALADSLRRLHDRGTVAGNLEPSKILLSGPGVQLQPGEPEGGITPYSSPEQLQGQAADARSDIFAFGAIVYEMFSGRKAFEGASTDELRTAILQRDPAPLEGDIARVTTKCLAKAPIERWQRMQRVQMELKLQTVFARRGEQEPAVKADRVQTMVREEIAQLEGRLAQRFSSHDAAAAGLQARLAEQETRLQAAAQAEQALRAEIAQLEARLGARDEAGDIKAAELHKEMVERLAPHDAAAAELRAGLAEHDAKLQSAAQAGQVLREEIAALETRLAARHDTAAAGLHAGLAEHAGKLQSAEQAGQALRDEIAALEARLAARHDAAAAGLHAGLAEHDAKLQSAAQTGQALRDEIAALEGRLTARHDAAAAGLHAGLAEHAAKLQSAAQAGQALHDEIAALEARFGARHDAGDLRAAELHKQIAEHAARLTSSGAVVADLSSRLDGVNQTLELHRSSLLSLESAITQTDDLVERVVEAFDSLEKSLGAEEMKAIAHSR